METRQPTRPLGDDNTSDFDCSNLDCFCITLDRKALCRTFEREVGDNQLCETLLATRPHLFSNVSVFLPERDLATMLQVVRAIEAVAQHPDYIGAVMSWAPASARPDFGPVGAFMGYDFHLGENAPRLIEINTNAGGALLNAVLARAQQACCQEVEAYRTRPELMHFDDRILRMFRTEWARQCSDKPLERVAIVDSRPEEQYLYPEFVLAQRLLERHGIEAVIADPSQLTRRGDALLLEGRPIDLIYNRLTDFSLEQTEHAVLREAYLDGAVVVTPNPYVHALLADKRNLTLLSDTDRLNAWGIDPHQIEVLTACIPRTVIVTPENAAALWSGRRQLFFKPAGGYGSKAAYRGDKLTRSVWEQIVRGEYVAQSYAPPSERRVRIDDRVESRKMDVRLYTYAGDLLLPAARLYQGQATNFRTPGGGFAPVLVGTGSG